MYDLFREDEEDFNICDLLERHLRAGHAYVSDSEHSVEIMESILQHLADEVEIDAFHHWISELCDPDSQLVQDANDKYFNKIKEEVELRNDANSMLGKKLTKH